MLRLDELLTKLPLWFASTTTTFGGDGGAGDTGGGDGDAGAGGDEGAGEGMPEGDTGEGDVEPAAEGTEEGADEGGEGEAADGEGSRAAGGRDDAGLPKHIKQALAKLREVDPKAADIARRGIYEANDFKQVFPNVREARAARDLLEEVGGSDGITTLQGEAKDYANELAAMSRGEKSVIDSLVEDFPDALPKLVPHALEALESIDKGAFEHLSAGIVTRTLADKGVAHNVLRLTELIADGKQDEAFKLAQGILNWVNGVKEYAGKQPDGATGGRGGETDRERRVREREERIEQDNRQNFGLQVGGEAIRMLNTMIDQALAPMLKSRRLQLNADQRKDFQNGARTEISNALARLPGYRDRMAALIDEGDMQAIIRYIRSKVQSSQMVRRAVTNAWQRRGFSGTRARAASGGGGSTTGVTKLNQKPAAEQIDWSKDRSRMRYMSGEATLKNGKVVRWANA